MIKRASIMLLVLSFLSIFILNSVLAETEPVYTYDNLNRIISIYYPDTDDSITYTYYDNSDVVFTSTYISSLEDGYEITYDPDGNILTEDYVGFEDDLSYSYYNDDSLKSIKGVDSTASFTYYSNGDILSYTTYVDGKKLTTVYTWDENGLLSSMSNLLEKSTYEYDENYNLIKETIYTNVGEGNEVYKTFEEVSYEYDSEGYLIAMIDGYTGERIEYGYDTIEYECEETFCEIPCSGQEECFPMYECDNSGENCVETSCLEVGFRTDTCSYNSLKNKTINNYVIEIEDTNADYEDIIYNANTWDESYNPTETFDDEGYLTEEENIIYNWETDSEGNKLLSDIVIPPPFEDDIPFTLTFGYTDYLLANNVISSFIVDSNVEYHYDVLGNLAWEEYVLGGDSSLTGAVIKILGNVILNDGESSKRYYVGMEGGSISEEEYYSYISSENIWPELQEYYSDACEGIDENGICIPNENFAEFPCTDMDAGENATFNSSYVDFANSFFYDSCLSNILLQEYECKPKYIAFGPLVARAKEVNCEFGCSMGACSSEGIISPQCIDDSDCIEGMVCINSNCISESDLPEEPEKPGRL